MGPDIPEIHVKEAKQAGSGPGRGFPAYKASPPNNDTAMSSRVKKYNGAHPGNHIHRFCEIIP